MGSAFVAIGAHGFWSRDGVLEIWLRLLALHLDQTTTPGSTIGAIRDRFLLASTGLFNGCVPHGLDEAIATPVGANAVRSANAALLAKMEAAPFAISSKALALLGISGIFSADVATSDLVDIGHALHDLLDGTIVWTADDAPVFPRSRST